MAFYHGRRVRVSSTAPAAQAVCDRCGQWVQHSRLAWQYDYRGKNLANLRLFVCERCVDRPQQQLIPKVLPPDPQPILNARPEPFYIDETNFLIEEGANVVMFTTEDGVDPMTMEGP